jgi:hypothetical protein
MVQIHIEHTFNISRLCALEAASRKVKAYVRLQQPCYDCPEKGEKETSLFLMTYQLVRILRHAGRKGSVGLFLTTQVCVIKSAFDPVRGQPSLGEDGGTKHYEHWQPLTSEDVISFLHYLQLTRW